MSDTKITDAQRLHQTPLEGALKCIVMSPTCCVSFAGNVHIAEHALTRLFQGATLARRELTSYLLLQHRENWCQTDFIVATVGEAISIDRISHGRLEEDLLSAWVGDAEAFAAYQANYQRAWTRAPQSQYLEERFPT